MSVRTADGARIEIQCCEWDQLMVLVDSGSRPLVNIKPNRRPRPGTNENEYALLLHSPSLAPLTCHFLGAERERESQLVCVHRYLIRRFLRFRTFQPDFVIVRKLVRGLTEREDYTNALYGLMISGLPSVNTFYSIHM